MPNRSEIKVVLTGGHAATPALGVVEEIIRREKNWKLYWVGPVSAMESQKITTAAEKTLNEYGVIVKKIVAGRSLRHGNLWVKLKAYLKIPFGFLHALLTIFKIKPDVVISFGGFAALPVVFAGWLTGKKVIIQEQIVGAGLANKLSSPFAKKIAVARSESLEFFPAKKTVLIGNPQVSKFFNLKTKSSISKPATIFVTGGSSGAKTINDVVDLALDGLLGEFNVIQQTGEANIEYFLKRKAGLPLNLEERYQVFGYVNPKLMAECFEVADIVISRSGANTVSDIVACRRPSILIPIPWTIGDEQTKNALKAAQTGIAVVLPQDELSVERLLLEVKKVQRNWQKMFDSMSPGDFALDRNAASSMVDLVEGLLV